MYHTNISVGDSKLDPGEVTCDRDTVCEGSDQTLLSYRLDKENRDYLDNWIEQLDLLCTPKSYIGMLGAMAFGGAAVACFFLPFLGDQFGRYKVYIVCSIIQLPLYILANTTHNLAILYILTFYLGVCLIGRFTCGFVLFNECINLKDQFVYGTILLTGDCAATLYITFFLRFISNDIHIIIWIGFGLNIFSVITAYWTLESPAWLLSVGEVDKAKETMATIAKFNGVQDFNITTLVENPDPSAEETTVADE